MTTHLTPGPELTDYDVILVNTSGGKDSQATLDVVVNAARAAGVLDRVIAVHADLGRVEWAGTPALAQRQAEYYEVTFHKVRHAGYADLLDRIETRGLWPASATRYCTAEFKRNQVLKLMTRLVDGFERERGDRVRILNVMGIRADESPARARKSPWQVEAYGSNKTKRQVDLWYPIFGWTEAEVWAHIEATGVEHHWAYDIGMPRLSCVFCVFAPRQALVLAARHNPELAEDYVRAEAAMDHTFRADLSMAEVVAEAKTAEIAGRPLDWDEPCDAWTA